MADKPVLAPAPSAPVDTIDIKLIAQMLGERDIQIVQLRAENTRLKTRLVELEKAAPVIPAVVGSGAP